MSRIAYALRADHEDTFGGGVLAVGDESLDVAAALKAGNGLIRVEETDTLTQAVLDGYPPLERVDASKRKTAKAATNKKTTKKREA